MYYQEKVIGGVLHIKTTPDGEWRKLTAAEITLNYMELKTAQLKRAKDSDCTCNEPSGLYTTENVPCPVPGHTTPGY